jgi:hypothetical protein
VQDWFDQWWETLQHVTDAQDTALLANRFYSAESCRHSTTAAPPNSTFAISVHWRSDRVDTMTGSQQARDEVQPTTAATDALVPRSRHHGPRTFYSKITNVRKAQMRTSSSTRHAFRVPVGRVVDPDHLNILQQRLAPLSHGERRWTSCSFRPFCNRQFSSENRERSYLNTRSFHDSVFA